MSEIIVAETEKEFLEFFDRLLIEILDDAIRDVLTGPRMYVERVKHESK